MNANDAAPSPRFQWLDRWLEPRWRALLTWVLVAAVTSAFFEWFGYQLIRAELRFVSRTLTEYAAINVPRSALDVAGSANVVLLLSWFQPVMLRLGLRRSLCWLGTCLVLGLVLHRVGAVFGPSVRPTWYVLNFGQLLGIPGFAAKGRRSRVWMSLIASGVASTAVFLLFRSLSDALWALLILSNLIYGAIMLYGTDPLPRRPARDEGAQLTAR